MIEPSPITSDNVNIGHPQPSGCGQAQFEIALVLVHGVALDDHTASLGRCEHRWVDGIHVADDTVGTPTPVQDRVEAPIHGNDDGGTDRKVTQALGIGGRHDETSTFGVLHRSGL